MLRANHTIKTRAERLRGEDGVTLIEVLVSMLLVGLIVLSFTGLDVAGRATADQRRTSQATQIAQQDQERLRGMSADQLATLDQYRNVTLDGNTYEVHSEGQYRSNSANDASCAATAGAADFAKVTTTVRWDANLRKDVVLQSLITPRIGGALVVQIIDQTGAGIAGIPVTATGTDPDTTGVVRRQSTDASGCVILGSLPVGTYTASGSLTGYVDANGASSFSNSVTTTAGNTSNLSFTFGQAGKINANFRAGTTTNQKAPSISWTNTGMATPGTVSVASPGATTISTAATNTLFPFTTSPGPYTGNYTVWAGRCAAAQPPLANQSTATVAPGATATMTGTTGAANSAVNMPAMNVVVTYKSSSTASATAVKPAHIKLTDSCNQTWTPEINTAAGPATPTGGWLRYPGQPYGDDYEICADYNNRKVTVDDNTDANENFAAATTQTVAIAYNSTSGVC